MLVWVFLTCACSQAHTPHCKYTCIVNVIPMKSCPTLKYLTALGARAHVCTPKLWFLIVHSVVLVCLCLHHRVLMFHTAPAWGTATFLRLLARYACKLWWTCLCGPMLSVYTPIRPAVNRMIGATVSSAWFGWHGMNGSSLWLQRLFSFHLSRCFLTWHSSLAVVIDLQLDCLMLVWNVREVVPDALYWGRS